MMSCAAVLEGALPGAWLLLVPAVMPFMNFSPWTGWIAFEELDMLLLAVLAGGYSHMAWARDAQVPAKATRERRLLVALLVVLALTGILSLVRGVVDSGGWIFDWFGGYEQAVNSLRVFKSVGFALLLWPLLELQLRSNAARVERFLALGMLLGLAWACFAVLWERAVFVGLWDFSANYRTVATFWEMHVGGAAIDAYLAMATPFSIWALVSARRPTLWFPAAALTLLVGYACLTTFSRGVYLAVAVQLLLMALVLLRRNVPFTKAWARWRLWGLLVVAALMLLEVVAVLGDDDSFMGQRLASARQDTSHRLEHWKSGLGLLDSPMDWMAGKGLGRMPANYSARVPGENFSGSLVLRSEPLGGASRNYAVLRVPHDLGDLPGTYALTQRVRFLGHGVHLLQMEVRVHQALKMTVLLCQRHLLYDRDCQQSAVLVSAPWDQWQTLRLPLLGPPLDAGSRPITFALSVDTPGGAVDVGRLQVMDGAGQKLLRNGDFSHALAHWLPAAQSYFVPWHIDNLYLELLIERGWLGLLALGTLIAWALADFLHASIARGVVAVAMAAGLVGVLVVGLVSSVLDVPRIALLFYLLPMVLLGNVGQRK